MRVSPSAASHGPGPVAAALDAVLALLRPLARFGAIGGGLLLLSAAVLVSVDVVARKLMNVSLGGSDELSGYAFAIGSAWSFAFVVLERGNVRVDALYARLPARARAFLDLLAIVALATFAAVVVRHGYTVLEQSIALSARSNSSLAVPLWIPQSIWWAGYVLFIATLLVIAARTLVAIATSDLQGAARLAAARSAVDDASDEIEQARARAEALGSRP